MAELEPVKDSLDSKLESLKEGQVTKGQHGGKREGAGFPKGQKKKKTLDKIKVNEAFRERILKHADDLFNAQYDLAIGEKVLMVKIKERNSEGKVVRVYHEQVTDKETIKQYLDYEYGTGGSEDVNDDEHFFYMTTKPANNQALESLLNRGLGKAPDKIEVEGGFFSQEKLIVKVVGSKHEDIEFGSDGTIVEPRGTGSGDDAERASGPSDSTPESPAGS